MNNLANTIANTFLVILGTYTFSAICYTVYVATSLY